MSTLLSPIVSSTRPTRFPSRSTTSQPRSIISHETGSAISAPSSDAAALLGRAACARARSRRVSLGGALNRLAADVPDRTLRPDRLRIREDAQDPQLSGNPPVVEALQAAAHHLLGGAVPEAAGNTEPEARRPSEARRVERGRPERGAIVVVARGQRGLAVEVAPVVRQSRERGLPPLDERRPVRRERRLGRLAAREKPELALD